MQRILVIGDIHGRLIWSDIIKKENPDKVIFLGDYVTTHESISAEQQLSNLEDILNYKEENSDKVILLRGNHDDQMLGYHWAECSGFDPDVYKGMIPMKDRFLSLTQWVYQIPDTNILCSHAGCSEQFLDNAYRVLKQKGIDYYTDIPIPYSWIINHLNSIEPCELFGFTPCNSSDYCGTSATQPCTWIRPYTLLDCGVKDIIHVVGHTPMKHICNLKDECLKINSEETFELLDMEIIRNYVDVWCCDCLANNEYLIIDNKTFIPKNYKNYAA